MRRQRLTHEFVDAMPQKLEEGKLYVCIQYATVAHLCCCGCGNEVVTPLTPTDWSLTYNGASLSLQPSIGNWGFPCESHYWIQRDRVRWDSKWTREEISRSRGYDQQVKARQFASAGEDGANALVAVTGGWWKKLCRYLSQE